MYVLLEAAITAIICHTTRVNVLLLYNQVIFDQANVMQTFSIIFAQLSGMGRGSDTRHLLFLKFAALSLYRDVSVKLQNHI